jgi:hypothetical protein
MNKKNCLLLPFVMLFSCSASLDESAITAEIETNVNEIRQAQLDLLIVGDFTPCGTATEAKAQASTTPRDWIPQKCWTKIGWAPSSAVSAGYWVEVAKDDFTVHGVGPDQPTGRIHMIATQSSKASRMK